MTDIVERLRKGSSHGVLIPCDDLTEAADEIERLRGQPQRASEPHWQKCPSCGFVGQDTVFFTRPERSPIENKEEL